MLYMEELVDAIIAVEGQTLMGLEFLTETLNLPMKKIELMFKKALGEYSERRPMKKTEVFSNYDMDGYITMPEGTTSCRVARYGVLPNQMPRFYMPKFAEQNVEFDPITRRVRVWPPVTPLRLTYTQSYVPTRNIQIQDNIVVPYETDEYDFTLPTMFAQKTLLIQKSVLVTDPETGEKKTENLTMVPVNKVEDEDIYGNKTDQYILEGTLGTGTVDTRTKEVNLQLINTDSGVLFLSYYPKYYVVPELTLNNRLFNRMFAWRLITALASLRAQATQEKLHNIDLTSDDLYARAQELNTEVREWLRNTISFGDMAPM